MPIFSTDVLNVGIGSLHTLYNIEIDNLTIRAISKSNRIIIFINRIGKKRGINKMDHETAATGSIAKSMCKLFELFFFLLVHCPKYWFRFYKWSNEQMDIGHMERSESGRKKFNVTQLGYYQNIYINTNAFIHREKEREKKRSFFECLS